MTNDETRARLVATGAGLTKLDEKHLAQLAQSVASARELAGKLPQDLHWSEEIALVFRLPRAAIGAGAPVDPTAVDLSQVVLQHQLTRPPVISGGIEERREIETGEYRSHIQVPLRQQARSRAQFGVLHASSEQLARGASGRLHAAVVTEPTNLEIRAFRIGFEVLDDLAGLLGLF